MAALARDLGDDALADRLVECAGARFGPVSGEGGEFYFTFGLDEPYPRGQLNDALMQGLATTEGAWRRLFDEPRRERFSEPTLHAVDYEALDVTQGHWDGERRTLAIALRTVDRSTGARDTTFRVANLPDPASARVEVVDGPPVQWRADGADLAVTTVLADQALLIG